jgi:hypothetical protein
MSFSAAPLSEEDLHGFVDNELDDERREMVLTHLSHTPADAARVETWRQQNILLRAAFAQVSLEQVPVSLSCTFTPRLISVPSFTAAGSPTRRRYAQHLQRRSLVFTVAGFVAGICLTLAAGFSVSHYSRLIASPSPLGPGLAVLATADLPAVPTKAAAQTLLHIPGAIEPALVTIPLLKSEGIELLRGEIRGRPDNPAHCLDFVDASATPIVLCVSAAKLPPDGEFQNLTTFAANAVYWRESKSIYALAAPLDHARLMALAKRIHARLDELRAP